MLIPPTQSLNHNLAAFEEKRLAALERYQVLDTPAEAELDGLTKLAAYICGSAMASISLIDERRQWFKSKIGLESDQTPRSESFCHYTIQGCDVFEVPDSLEDERFKENLYVTGPPHVRHYCGAPLVTPDGYRIGALCVMDRAPKTLTECQQEALKVLAGEVVVRFELKRQQEQLRQQKQSAEYNERRFKALFEHSSGYLYTHNLAGQILSVNQAAARAMQSEPADMVGRNITDFIVDEKAFKVYLAKITAKNAMSGIVKIRTDAGEERYWQYSNVLCKDQLEEPLIICSAHDVTEKEIAQQILLQAEKELTTQVQLRTTELSAVNHALEITRDELESFLYRASHDLKGPVCSLRGAVQLMQIEGVEGEHKVLLNMMEQTAMKLEHAMESILEYSNNRHDALNYDRVDLPRIVDQAVEYSKRLKEFGRVQLDVKVDALHPFYSDAYRVQLIIHQLLSNSISFQDLTIASPYVHITLVVDSKRLTMCFEDNGVGVPPDTMPLIFDRFVRASKQSIGSGLGLYIVKEALKKLGGKIEVLSFEGKGTCFLVEIPNRPPAR